MKSICRKPRLLVVGSLVMDLIVTTGRMPATGETVTGENFTTAPGGKGANQAVQAARLGAEVTMVGRVGDDAFGRALLQSLIRERIDVSHVYVTDGCSSAVGNIVLAKQPDGTLNNRIIVAPGANMRLTRADVAFLEETIASYDMVLLQLEIPMDVNEAVAGYAAKCGVPVMLNPAPYSPLSDTMLSGVEYISPNETEAQSMLGFCAAVGENGIEQADAQSIARIAAEKHIRKLILTLGGNGAACISSEGAVYRPAAKGVSVADPTAAGDSFVGAFCTAHTLGYSDEDALDIACHTAAITVGGIGAQPSLPHLSDVLASLDAHGVPVDTSALRALTEYPNSSDANKATPEKALDAYMETVTQETGAFFGAYERGGLFAAAELILQARNRGNRIHVTGIGKPAHIAAYAASLFSSTGVPTYYLHGTEAVHGSCGQLVQGDVVIFISNSGETAEMKTCLQAVINNGCTIIGVSGSASSYLAQHSSVHLIARVSREGGPLGRAPRASILAETMVLQALSVITQTVVGWDAAEYVKRHPGGALGKL